MIIIHYQVAQLLNFHSLNKTHPTQKHQNSRTLDLLLFLVGDYLEVMWEGSICISRIITTVSDKSSNWSAIRYTEDNAHIYTTASEEDEPIDHILLLLPSTSYSIKDDTK